MSERAIARGYRQLGTLGSGNHYLEIQVVHGEDVFAPELARAFGMDRPEQVVIMFHCGSRGFGHQVATDYLHDFLRAMPTRFGLPIVDRQLSCAPFASQEGRDYHAAMCCAANMSFANRQVILHRIGILKKQRILAIVGQIDGQNTQGCKHGRLVALSILIGS